MKRRFAGIHWVFIDIVLLALSLVLAVFVAYNLDFGVLKTIVAEKAYFSYSLVVAIGSNFVYLLATKRYRVLWQYASAVDYVVLGLAPVASMICLFLAAIAGLHFNMYNIYIIYFMLAEACIVGTRAIVRINAKITGSKNTSKNSRKKQIMVIGAGDAARILIEDVSKNQAFPNSAVRCVIDDDEVKQNKYVNGVKVVGTRYDIISSAKKYDIDIIVFAIPSMSKNERSEILKICTQTGCEVRTMPSVDEAVHDAGKVKSRKVKIEDLLERLPIKLEMNEKMSYVTDKIVMVTGGGGSIGSELCRQIVKFNPKLLIIFDVYENNAYDIQNELRQDYPEANVLALIGSVRDSKRMECIFKKYRPEIVYHAAAHKHVPLMEDSPNEAIKNNVFGTYKTAEMADKYGTSRFVLISTDKAVNPTNVMGASKRMCEMIVQSFSRKSKTEFVAVRFGNVLGSNGSVIPLFRKQIEAGGPVKVTHPDIIRYFMTIPEAVSLVLTAGAMAKGGEIFVLDMGKPVKIVDLAKNMIRLMGYKLDEEIKIEFTGLRPGEKLYEELLMGEEGLENTENELIHVGKPIEFDDGWFKEKLDELKNAMYDDSFDIRILIHEIVPTYKENK